jgi:glycosyltransferase involved in cell wall biosynthesis
MIKVTVIIPAYNAEKYLARCLRSIINQSMPEHEYEIILIDDGSNDDTANIIKCFEQSNLIHLTNPDNKGLPYSLNKGICQSRGEFIVRLDADDFVNRDYLFFLFRVLDDNSKIDAVACDYIEVNDDEDHISVYNPLVRPIGCAIMFRKKDMESIGLYNTEFRINEEVEFMRRFKEKFLVSRLCIPLYRYRQHGNSLTTIDPEKKNYYDNMLK